ncbi:MAG: pilus assembly protein [Novosphingobium sp.]|nr:pilus assembly protein [Novosphingobium sp.]
MNRLATLFSRIGGDTRGAVAIETAFVAPMLILMSVGGFEVSQMVARQHELQSGASEATAIALAGNQGAVMENAELKLDNLLTESLFGQVEGNENKVLVSRWYRCDARNTKTQNKSDCENSGNDKKRYSTYIRIIITDEWEPTWKKIGLGSDLDYRVERWIQIQ